MMIPEHIKQKVSREVPFTLLWFEVLEGFSIKLDQVRCRSEASELAISR